MAATEVPSVHDSERHSNVLNRRSWSRKPNLGEAENPGPYAAFDNEESDAWIEHSDPFREVPEHPGVWMFPPTGEEIEQAECETKLSNEECSTGAAEAANTEDVLHQKWQKEHADKEFVPAKGGKKVTKASKFDGLNVGWVFKTGEHGLGYYRDRDVVLQLEVAVRPM